MKYLFIDMAIQSDIKDTLRVYKNLDLDDCRYIRLSGKIYERVANRIYKDTYYTPSCEEIHELEDVKPIKKLYGKWSYKGTSYRTKPDLNTLISRRDEE